MFGICRRLLIGLVGLAAVCALPSTGARASPVATGAHIAVEPGATRFTVDLTEAVAFQVFTMRDPYRVVIDLPELGWRAPAAAARAHGGAIDRFRYGLFRPGTFRIVLDVNRPVAAHGVALSSTNGTRHWLRFDIIPISKAEFDRTYVGPPVVAAARPDPPPLAVPHRRTDGRRVVVIDPGHGGVDPGTTGLGGEHEKDITLAAGLELKQLLDQGARYKVVMTRTRDIFLPLHERVAIARANHADLFISLHADSIQQRGISGASVYTLSDKASDAEAAALAADENRADAVAGANLTGYPEEVANILIDLAQRETKNDSVKIAHLLIGQIDQTEPVLEHSVRSAGFAVLKAPDVPSVLIEMGYLSNTTDERLLRDPRSRAKLMQAIKRAVDAYFTDLDHLTRS